MTRTIMIGATAIFLALGATQASAGNGALDFLDPCVEARDSFRDQRMQILASYDAEIAAVETAAATPEYRDAWFKAKKEQARPIFNNEVAPLLTSFGVTDLNGAFEKWFSNELAQFSASELSALINEHFRQEMKQAYLEERATTNAELDRQKRELHNECKMTVGDQILRGTMTTVMAPIEIVKGNLEGAKRESSVLNKTIRATTGISVRDIKKHGLGGGKNSEVRKAGRAIGKVFGW